MATKTPAAPAAEAMTTMVERVTNGFGGNADGLMQANAQAVQSWLADCEKINRELMAFYASRWNSNVETARQLARCTDPVQALQVQAAGVQTALQQYMDAAAKVADMASAAGATYAKQVEATARPASQTAAKKGA